MTVTETEQSLRPPSRPRLPRLCAHVARPTCRPRRRRPKSSAACGSPSPALPAGGPGHRLLLGVEGHRRRLVRPARRRDTPRPAGQPLPHRGGLPGRHRSSRPRHPTLVPLQIGAARSPARPRRPPSGPGSSGRACSSRLRDGRRPERHVVRRRRPLPSRPASCSWASSPPRSPSPPPCSPTGSRACASPGPAVRLVDARGLLDLDPEPPGARRQPPARLPRPPLRPAAVPGSPPTPGAQVSWAFGQPQIHAAAIPVFGVVLSTSWRRAAGPASSSRQAAIISSPGPSASLAFGAWIQPRSTPRPSTTRGSSASRGASLVTGARPAGRRRRDHGPQPPCCRARSVLALHVVVSCCSRRPSRAVQRPRRVDTVTPRSRRRRWNPHRLRHTGGRPGRHLVLAAEDLGLQGLRRRRHPRRPAALRRRCGGRGPRPRLEWRSRPAPDPHRRVRRLTASGGP